MTLSKSCVLEINWSYMNETKTRCASASTESDMHSSVYKTKEISRKRTQIRVPTRPACWARYRVTRWNEKRVFLLIFFYRLDGLAIAPTRCAASRASCTVFYKSDKRDGDFSRQNTNSNHPEQVRFQQTHYRLSQVPGYRLNLNEKSRVFLKFFSTVLNWKAGKVALQ